MSKKTTIEFGEIDLNNFEFLNNLLNNPKILKTHNESIDSVILSNDDKYIISLSSNSKSFYNLRDKISYIKIWDFQTGKCLRIIKSNKGINSIAISNDNKYIILGNYNSIEVWDFETGKCSKVIETNNENYLITITKDNKYIIISDSLGDNIEILDFKTGKCLKTMDNFLDEPMIVYINSLIVTDNNKYIIAGYEESPKSAGIWDFKTGKLLEKFEFHVSIASLAISTDNKYIIAGEEDENKKGSIKIWDINSLEYIKIIKTYGEGITSIAISNDNKFIISGSWDNNVKVWDFESGRCLKTFEGYNDSHNRGIASLAISSDNRYIVSGGNDGKIKIWDFFGNEIENNIKLLKFNIAIKLIKKDLINVETIVINLIKNNDFEYLYKIFKNLSKDKIFNFLSNNTKYIEYLFKYTDKKRIPELFDMVIENKDIKTTQFLLQRNFLPNKCKIELFYLLNENNLLEKYLPLFNSKFKNYVIKNSKLYNLKTLEGHRSFIETAIITNDGKHIISGADNGDIKIWDFKSGKSLKTLKGHNDIVLSIDISKNNKFIVSGSLDDTIRIWNFKTGKCFKVIKDNDGVSSVLIINNDKFIISSSWDITTIKIWNIETGEYRSLEGHKKNIDSIAISNDNKYIISTSSDNTIKMWDFNSGKCLKTFEDFEEMILSVIIANDNKYLISKRNNFVRIWDIETGKCLRTIEEKDDIDSVILSDDNKYLFLGFSGVFNKDIKIYEFETGKYLQKFNTDSYDSKLYSVVLNDNKYIILGSDKKNIEIWAKYEFENKIKGLK
jgi:WD40 repeat protein